MSEEGAFNGPSECFLLLYNATILKGLFSNGVFFKKLLRTGVFLSHCQRFGKRSESGSILLLFVDVRMGGEPGN
jgi:hypothetical protein